MGKAAASIREAIGDLGVLVVAAVMLSPVLYLMYLVMLEPMVDDFRASLSNPQSSEEPGRSYSRVAEERPSPRSRAVIPPEFEQDLSRGWSCGYAPTYNNDWHDDVLCSDGVNRIRPYLLPKDSFVTETEMRNAAVRYAAELNAR